MPEWIVPPDGVGDVPCDHKWRVRLPTPYANYFLAFEPEKKTGQLYTATLNAEDILLWPKSLFSLWRRRLLRGAQGDREQTRQMLAATQFYGGDTEIDEQGRFVLPRNLREALRLETPPKNFKIYNDGIIRVVTQERLDIAKRDFAPPNAVRDNYAVDQFIALVGPDDDGEGGMTR